MQTYETIIDTFLVSEFPNTVVSTESKFEAAVQAILGTKQRRFGPMPTPEVQVKVREVVRGTKDLHFFIPWACAKQDYMVSGIDILEVFALKQLRCLSQALNDLGYTTNFHFRIEDATDQYLFRDQSLAKQAIHAYGTALHKLIQVILHTDGSKTFVNFETLLDVHDKFDETADGIHAAMYAHLQGGPTPHNWFPVPEEQALYYYDLYSKIYPNEEPEYVLATYLSTVYARSVLKMKGLPQDPFVFLTFGHPVPGSPIVDNRLFYRTLKESFTNKHVSPWMGLGYLQVNDQTSTVCPRYMEPGIKVTPKRTMIGNVIVNTPYQIV